MQSNLPQDAMDAVTTTAIEEHTTVTMCGDDVWDSSILDAAVDTKRLEPFVDCDMPPLSAFLVPVECEGLQAEKETLPPNVERVYIPLLMCLFVQRLTSWYSTGYATDDRTRGTRDGGDAERRYQGGTDARGAHT